ncbi:3-phosphoshikimate 1-carboxyvinyltransferase [Lacibacter sediminis]|uniref:3-phosphoshikimate 1-carboxyvinyltransferase n=1 Tax=Lacibacter sediminis TaxID=2760713 RepID=A0A7G5XDU6_9BACT|nr:3-phosphoshikimate 1-carboxyvinyltransferase [Lacibacter sediminis]QNA43649.1 3-phosphoshikimate 1-carboxyvinyltransferase [Lacibacter sediminis]
MKVTIQPSTLTGTIQSNASKSSMQRACAAALVAKGKSVIKNPGHSNDDKAAMDITQRLGGIVSSNDNELIIESNGVQPVSSEINCGESGLSIRMFTPLVALSNHALTVNGTGSLTTRPMDFFDEILPQLDVHVKSNQGKLPLNIQGPIVPKNITIDGSLSSQFLTGLLLAYAASDASDVSITVTNLKSKPYIDLTLDVMKQFGLKVPENKNYESFYFAPTTHHSPLTTHHYTVEGDWSGAAFLLVAGAVAGNIVVKGLDVFSTQADKAVLQALMDCGCIISIQPEQIEIGPAPLKPFHFNATECPDLFPPLVALASYCNGKSVIEGTTRLTHKESNRAITLQEEFAKLGVTIELQDDLMIVHGGDGLKGATVHSRHDHRIAMACAVAALKADADVTIEEAEAINKSYPDFYEHLKLLKASVSY